MKKKNNRMLRSRPFLKKPSHHKSTKKRTHKELNLIEHKKTHITERNLAFTSDFHNLTYLKICPIQIPFEVIEPFKKTGDRIPDVSDNWAREYVKICDDKAMKPIAEYIRDHCTDYETGEKSDEEVILALLSFVQDKEITESLQYNWEGGYLEFPKYPLETLWDGGGDCEDFAILFTSLAASIGYDVILITVLGYNENGERNKSDDHVYAGVCLKKPPKHHILNKISEIKYNNKIYYPCECTNLGWLIGDCPETNPEYNRRDIYPVQFESKLK